MSRQLKRRTLQNLGITAASRGLTMLMQIGANVVVARSLSDVDFGIVGFALIFIGLLSMLSEFGLTNAAVQRPQLNASELNTGSTLRLLLGIFGFAIVLVIAPGCARALGEPAVADVLALLAVGFLINAFAFIPSVQMARALDYRNYAIAQVCGAAVNSMVTIALALNGFAYWSIVLANIAATAATVAALNLFAGKRLKFELDRPSVVRYRSFGGSLLTAGLFTFAVMNLGSLFVGALAGASLLGYYALAHAWGSKLAEALGSIMNTVLFPTFSKIQTDRPRLRSAYLIGLELTAFLTLGGYSVLYAVSEPFLVEVLGKGTDKWLPALAALRILCIYGVLRALVEPVGSVIMAIGGPMVLVRANLLALICKGALIYPGYVVFGIEGVAAAATVGYAAQFLIVVPVVSRQLEVSSLELLRTLAGPGLSALVTIVLVSMLSARGWLGGGLNEFVAGTVVGGLSFVVTYGILSNGKRYREFLELVRPAREQ